MSNKVKRDSPLIQSVLALDNHLSELERIGAKINSTDMASDIDVEYIQKLMNRFAECGLGVSQEVANLSTQLQLALARLETVSNGVSGQAEFFKNRSNQQNEKIERFRVLGEKVRELSGAIGEFRRPQGQNFSDEDRRKLLANIPVFEAQLSSLIEELQDFLKSARDSRMKTLERNAESLSQSLQAARKRLRDLSPPPQSS